MTTAVIIVYTSTYVASFQTSLITIGHPFPPVPDGKVVWYIMFLGTALLFYLIAETTAGSKLRPSARPGPLKTFFAGPFAIYDSLAWPSGALVLASK